MYQTGHGNNAKKWAWNATEGGAAGWKLDPPRPVIDGEINYEAHIDYHTKQRITDLQVRRAAYYSLLAAPPAGITYGAHGIWPWLRKREVPLAHPNSGEGDPWFECLDYPGARQMKVLRDVFESLEWWKLRPDPSLLADSKQEPMVMAARADTFALIYLPGNASIQLSRPFAKAAWIDPRTGERRPASGGPAFNAPGPGDWLLLAEQK
jgi:hypothetical protein